MSPAHLIEGRSRIDKRQRGYSLVEILVALVIALFLLAGIGTMVAGTRKTSTNQVSLAMLQDQERLAMSMLNDTIQTAGYFDTATYWSTNVAFKPAVTTTGFTTNLTLPTGQTLIGYHSSLTAPDMIAVRFATTGSDGILSCNGTGASGAAFTFVNVFYVNTTTKQLMCSPDGTFADAIPLVDNVVNMQAYYGVSTVAGACNAPGVTCNVDTYMTADLVGTLWPNVVSVRLTLTFQNPMATTGSGAAVAGQPPYVYFTRVIALQGRTL